MLKMYTLQFLFYSLIFSIIGTSAEFNSDDTDELETLQFVQVIFRHGDKNPVRSYPNDPYKNESLWPGGWNNITDKGMRRMFDLGIYFRKRYAALLSKEYLADEIEVLSSQYDRTIISARYFLTGLYKDNDSDSQWDSDLQLYSDRVQILVKRKERLIDVNEPCLKMEKIVYDQISDSECSQKLLTDNQEIIDYLGNHSGIKEKNFFTVTLTFQTLQIEAEQELELPPWTKRVLDYKPLAGFLMAIHRNMHKHNEGWTSLRSGPLTQKLISNMEDKISEDDENGRKGKKMVVFSGHDRTVVEIMLALNIYDPDIEQPPPYGATLLVELHRNENKYFIEVFYKNDTSASPYKLIIPGCGSPCYIDDFKRIASSFIPKDWKQGCQLGSEKNFTYSPEIKEALYGKDDSKDDKLFPVLIVCLLAIIGMGGMFLNFI